MSKRKTHEQFIKEFNEKNPNAKNIEILEKYTARNKKILCKCKIDGHKWSPVAKTLLGSKSMKPCGCPKCGYRRNSENFRETHEDFLNKLSLVNPNIEVLEKYQTNSTPLLCKCKIDGYEWHTRPSHLLGSKNAKPSGCPKCSGKAKKTTKEFIEEIYNINPNIEILGEYKNSGNPIKCKCKIDNFEWYPTPDNLLQNHGCPCCNQSRGEKNISRYLENKKIEYKSQYKFEDCKFYKQLPFDFYLPKYNCCIEFDGKQHYEIVEHFGGLENFIDIKIRDTIKNIYCQQNNIKLIRILYSDLKNIEVILENELK